MKLIDTIARVPVIITTGTGGVGKTSISVAISIALAQSRDVKVLVVTIDPARRLANVLCEDELGHEPRLIDHSKFITDQEIQGELYAAMVDTEQGWKEIVDRYSKSDNDSKRIFENKLYANLTTRFSHSHDFVAMDQLYEHYRSGKYDYIVLDTPPTSQAFGFFDAPQAMSEFFGGRLVRLITSPYRLGKGRAAKIFDLASQPFFALADKVLGKQFLNDIGEFFFLFHTMYDDFADRATTITNFLASKKTHSLLVLNPNQFIANADSEIQKGLSDRHIDVEAMIINGVPIHSADFQDVDEFLKSNNNNLSFVEFLNNDIKLSRAVSTELFSRGHKGSEAVSYATIGRVPVLDETGRLKQLVSSVQTNNVFDDTI